MRSEVVIIGERIEDLLAASTSVREVADTLTMLQTRDVAQRAQAIAPGASRRLVLFLTERDNLAELRKLLESTSARVLLVAPRSPPSAPLARLAAEFGANLCGRDDSPAVREAMLVLLVASGPKQTAHS